MENLVIEPKNKTPKINFDASSGLMEIMGISCAENSVDFYKPIIEWIETYKKRTTISNNG